MNDRHTVDSITSDALDALYESLEAAQDTELYRQLQTADQAFASASVRAALLGDQLAKARTLHRETCPWAQGRLNGGFTCSMCDALDEPGPAATEATQTETTARVFAGLHHSAEQDVTRVINLYERWVKAGPPPLGVSLSRWWDQRLIELRNAILPLSEQPARTTVNNPATSTEQP